MEIFEFSKQIHYEDWKRYANLAVEKKLSVAKLKEEVGRWKKVVAKAEEHYQKLAENIEIGNKVYFPK